MAGRRPKPAALREAQGNPGRRPIAASDADPVEAEAADAATGAPTLPSVASDAVPEELVDTPDAVAAWKLTAPALARMRIFRETDRNGLIRYCLKLAQYNRVRLDLASPKEQGGGEVYQTDTNHGKMWRINPRFQVLERIERSLIEYEDRYGLNPMSRQRILAAYASGQAALPLNNPNQQPTAPAGPASDKAHPPGRSRPVVGALRSAVH